MTTERSWKYASYDPGAVPDSPVPVDIGYNPATGNIEDSSMRAAVAEAAGGGIALVADDTSKAPANWVAIQSAFNNQGIVRLTVPGVIWVDTTLIIRSHTKLEIGPLTTLKLTGGTARNLIINQAFASPVFTNITSLTASGNYVTVTSAGHPFTVGQWVNVEGVGALGYNGTHRIAAADANTYSYYSPLTPTNLAPAVYTGPIQDGGTWVMRATPADVNIRITGGGTIDWNGQNQTFPPTIATYGVILHRVYAPHVEDVWLKNALKYAICVAGSAGLRARAVRLDTLSDGFDVMAPTFNAQISGVSGSSGDDFVSILCGDTQKKTFSVGDVVDVSVQDIDSQGPTSMCAIKLAGCAPFIFDEVHGRNIGGTGRINASVAIIDDVDMVGGLIGNVSFHNISRRLSGTTYYGEMLNMRMTGSARKISVSGTYNGTSVAAVRVDPGVTLGQLDVDVQCEVAATGLPLVQILGTVNEVNQRGSTGPNFAGHLGRAISATCVVANWRLSGDYRGTTAAKGLYHTEGTVTTMSVNGVALVNVRGVYESEAPAANDVRLLANNVTLTGGLGLALLRRGASVHMSNLYATGITSQLITDSNNGFTVNAYFGADVVSSNSLFANGASNTINAYGLTRSTTISYSTTPTFTLCNNPVINFGGLTGDVTSMTLNRIPPAGEKVTFIISQDATGSRQITWPAACIFPAAFVQAAAGSASKKTIVNFLSTGTQLVAQGTNAWA